jgi:hypothetical protein
MTPTLTRLRSAPPKNLGGSLMVSAGVAAVVVIAVALLPGMQLPALVSRVTVANPTLYGVEVDVTSAPQDAWLGLGGFPPESSRDSFQIIDQGRNWLFRFSYGGQEIGRMAMSRAELQRSQWRVTVPAELGDRLEAAGLTPSAHG